MLTGHSSSFLRAHHAVVFSIALAARRQVRVTLRSQRKERRSERQSEESQQRDGKKLTQSSSLKHQSTAGSKTTPAYRTTVEDQIVISSSKKPPIPRSLSTR